MTSLSLELSQSPLDVIPPGVEDAKTKFQQYKLKADPPNSDPQARAELGYCYEKGIGVDPDIKQALYYYELSADQSNVTGLARLGHCYINGIGGEVNIEKGIGCLKASAAKGEPNGLCSLGICYLHGKGVPKDTELAEELFIKSALRENPEAIYHLGELYQKIDLSKARSLYEVAAAQGFTPAQVELEKIPDAKNRISLSELISEEMAKNASEVSLDLKAKDGTKLLAEKVKLRALARHGIKAAQFMLGQLYEVSSKSRNLPQAVHWYKEAADQGYAKAQYQLGMCYYAGIGVTQDTSEALRWWQQASNRNAAACLKLSVYYQNGTEVEKDMKQSHQWLFKAAELGNCSVQAMIGGFYQNGEQGFEQDELKALSWYNKAARSGHELSQRFFETIFSQELPSNPDEKAQLFYRKGLCYSEGINVPKDELRAFEYFLEAAKLKNADAANQLGIRQGFTIVQQTIGSHTYLQQTASFQCLPKEKEKAYNWFLKAAEQGNKEAQSQMDFWRTLNFDVPDYKGGIFEKYWKSAEQGDRVAQYELAICYSEGRGVAADDKAAFNWFFKAAEQGYAPAQYQLGSYYSQGLGVQQDTDAALSYMSKAAGQEYAPAQYLLGAIYSQGAGVAKNDKTAFEYFLIAAKAGIEGAQHKLGRCYELGLGTKRNKKEAFKWYSKSAEQNYPPALYDCGRCREKGIGTHKSKYGADQFYRRAAFLGYTPPEEKKRDSKKKRKENPSSLPQTQRPRLETPASTDTNNPPLSSLQGSSQSQLLANRGLFPAPSPLPLSTTVATSSATTRQIDEKLVLPTNSKT